eukprot:364089-Chlamydomonas_euryale.AAC.8
MDARSVWLLANGAEGVSRDSGLLTGLGRGARFHRGRGRGSGSERAGGSTACTAAAQQRPNAGIGRFGKMGRTGAGQGGSRLPDTQGTHGGVGRGQPVVPAAAAVELGTACAALHAHMGFSDAACAARTPPTPGRPTRKKAHWWSIVSGRRCGIPEHDSTKWMH